MPRLIQLLLRVGDVLGNGGAVANAGALGAQRRREAWVVESLERAVARSAATGRIRRTA